MQFVEVGLQQQLERELEHQLEQKLEEQLEQPSGDPGRLMAEVLKVVVQLFGGPGGMV